MSGSKSKNKGKGFEREVCNILSEIYQDNFERVPYSGAFVGGINAARKSTLTENQIKAFKGDVIPPDDWKYFNCECKNYADFPFHKLLQEKPMKAQFGRDCSTHLEITHLCDQILVLPQCQSTGLTNQKE